MIKSVYKKYVCDAIKQKCVDFYYCMSIEECFQEGV